MKVVVTGAGGQLGAALLATAPVDGEVTPLTRATVDLTNDAAVAAMMRDVRPDLVINAAAYTAVDRAESEADAAYAVNRDVPGRLASLAREFGARFVHVSTDFVFAGTAGTPYAPADETDPLGVYGASKLAGEQAVREVKPDALIIRTAWVYGANGANFVKTMLRLMVERPEVRVIADQIGTPTHAASLARAIWSLAEAGATGFHHYTDAGVASWYDFAVAIQEEALALGLLRRAVPVLPIRTADYPTPAKRPAYSVLDKTGTWALLPAAAPHWRQELRHMLADLKASS